MTRRERLLEQYEDAFFALLMEDVMIREGARLEARNQRLLEDPAAAAPESLDRRCLRAIDHCASALKRQSARRRAGKILRSAAVAAAMDRACGAWKVERGLLRVCVSIQAGDGAD